MKSAARKAGAAQAQLVSALPAVQSQTPWLSGCPPQKRLAEQPACLGPDCKQNYCHPRVPAERDQLAVRLSTWTDPQDPAWWEAQDRFLMLYLFTWLPPGRWEF